jgi:hypothetical protein
MILVGASTEGSHGVEGVRSFFKMAQMGSCESPFLCNSFVRNIEGLEDIKYCIILYITMSKEQVSAAEYYIRVN